MDFVENSEWILIDTQIAGLKKPIYVVELAAQKMRCWEREGGPFRLLLNHNCSISIEASRIHGYTQNLLERDGSLPEEVYQDFERYVDGLTVAAYDLSHDWDDVLVPEWERLGIPPIGVRGFCLYQLAQRLLDPVPAENCKLETLCHYYRLPDHGVNRAAGGLESAIDLMREILLPMAERCELNDWEQVINYSNSEWYPSRLPFGKFKGRPFLDAKDDEGVRAWLSWLSESSNEKSSRMGRWYLEQLESGAGSKETFVVDVADEANSDGASGIIIFKHPGIEHYQQMVKMARKRLADLELEYGVEKSKVDSVRSKLFEALSPYYQERDRLCLLIQYRNAYIENLIRGGEGAAEETVSDFEQASSEQEEEYSSAASSLEGKRELDEEEADRLRKLWVKLVRMYHPDQYEQNPGKKQTYELLTKAINGARDRGDIELLELIAENPQAFILKQGWASVSLDDSDVRDELQSLFEILQVQILGVIESLKQLRSSSDFELYQMAQENETAMDRVIESQKLELEVSIDALKFEAEKKALEIEELTGKVAF